MREYSATVGATDGNIIAAIITTQIPRNHPIVPRPVHGPSSIPRIRSAVHHQLTAASANSSATSPTRARVAANAGAIAVPRLGRSRACATATSGGPGEPRRRQPRLPFVLDAEGVDPGTRRFRDREIRRHRMEHAVEPNRLARLDPEGHDVLDFEVDHV